MKQRQMNDSGNGQIHKPKRKVIKWTVVAAVCLFAAVFVGKFFLEDIPENKNNLALKNYRADSEGGYKDAKKYIKSAIFWEKYIVFWNDNTRLPLYYYNLGRAEQNLNEHEDAAKAYREALKLFPKYDPEDYTLISNSYECLILVDAHMGNNEEVIDCSLKDLKLREKIDNEAGYNVASQCIMLGGAYSNLGKYKDAASYYDRGIPLFYESTDWGLGDDNEAGILTVAYYMAAHACLEAGDSEKSDKYMREYKDMVWLRDYTEKDIRYYADDFGWKIDW